MAELIRKTKSEFVTVGISVEVDADLSADLSEFAPELPKLAARHVPPVDAFPDSDVRPDVVLSVPGVGKIRLLPNEVAALLDGIRDVRNKVRHPRCFGDRRAVRVSR